ncbi:arsenate reductase (thioredoxin) [Secundilactobacillus kimchicus]|uniref:arsenate reductase (thioredoxin) n=1 Tax=Secundilactobacillus kimchicus TaxID=528209 RepID=UPI0024A857D0|nr:arsenate reductase (thioredoxin) [Secundilactobacillus kimchicus]
MKLDFLCTGNSCRSQMAEGFAKRLLPADWQIHSAGIRADGLNPIAVRVMAEIVFDISDQTSTVLDPKALQNSDLIVTLCGDARDHCPVTPARVQKQHWPLLDPAQATGSEAEVLDAFRTVRDAIKARVTELAESEMS